MFTSCHRNEYKAGREDSEQEISVLFQEELKDRLEERGAPAIREEEKRGELLNIQDETNPCP